MNSGLELLSLLFWQGSSSFSFLCGKRAKSGLEEIGTEGTPRPRLFWLFGFAIGLELKSSFVRFIKPDKVKKNYK
jgi:hypothetical protein